MPNEVSRQRIKTKLNRKSEPKFTADLSHNSVVEILLKPEGEISMKTARELLFIKHAALYISCHTSVYQQMSKIPSPLHEPNEILLNDITLTIQSNYLAAKTRLFFPHGGEKFAMALEASLRRCGFEISTDEKARDAGDIQLSYKISEVEVNLSVLSVIVGESFQINRLISNNLDNVKPTRLALCR